MGTFSIRAKDIKRDWFIVDASNQRLGRLSSEVASRLRGKHKAEYTPHMDVGDYIIVINAKKIALTGNKLQNKLYYRHSGYVGHLHQTNLETMLAKKPEEVIKIAVKGMLPKGPLGRKMLKKMKIYSNENHQHQAQNPKPLTI